MDNYQIEVSTNIGNEKNENQDNYFVNGIIRKNNNQYNSFLCKVTEYLIIGVFDGMSESSDGEMASCLLSKEFLKNKKTNKEKVEDYIRNVLQRTNNMIRKRNLTNCFSGTTATILVLNNKSEFKIFHIGDSKAYCVSDEKMIPLTKDDTIGQLMIDIGVYEKIDGVKEYEKNALINYVGIDCTGEELFIMESDWKPFRDDQKILICTDGLTKMCLDKEICDIMVKNEYGISKKLNNAALKHGGYDNVTSVVIKKNRGT